MKFLKLEDLDVAEKRVLVRVDFNVPLDESGAITNDKRIKAALPTIEFLLKNNSKVILMSHLGRPKGKVVANLKMDVVAERLGELLNKTIKKMDDCVGDDVKKAVDKMDEGDVVLLENLRFHKEEKENDDNFSKELSRLADLYVNDAFGTCHRAHASVVGVTNDLISSAGFLVQKEIEIMGKALKKPKKPFVAILGGAKVSDKIGVIDNLLKKVDKILIGGAMALTFLRSQGLEVGNSKVEIDKLDVARKILDKGKDKIVLPIDFILADKFDNFANSKIAIVQDIEKGWLGLDIGPDTVRLFNTILKEAKTVIWNGPMGVFEMDNFSKGTEEIAKTLSKLDAVTIIGGGDSAAAVEELGVSKKMTHVSTGGGASLEFFEGKILPGFKALEESFSKYKK